MPSENGTSAKTPQVHRNGFPYFPWNPVRDIYGGLPSDYSTLLSDSINQAINGTDWYSTRDSIVDTVNTGLEEINAQIDKLR